MNPRLGIFRADAAQERLDARLAAVTRRKFGTHSPRPGAARDSDSTAHGGASSRPVRLPRPLGCRGKASELFAPLRDNSLDFCARPPIGPGVADPATPTFADLFKSR